MVDTEYWIGMSCDGVVDWIQTWVKQTDITKWSITCQTLVGRPYPNISIHVALKLRYLCLLLSIANFNIRMSILYCSIVLIVSSYKYKTQATPYAMGIFLKRIK